MLIKADNLWDILNYYKYFCYKKISPDKLFEEFGGKPKTLSSSKKASNTPANYLIDILDFKKRFTCKLLLRTKFNAAHVAFCIMPRTYETSRPGGLEWPSRLHLSIAIYWKSHLTSRWLVQTRHARTNCGRHVKEYCGRVRRR